MAVAASPGAPVGEAHAAADGRALLRCKRKLEGVAKGGSAPSPRALNKILEKLEGLEVGAVDLAHTRIGRALHDACKLCADAAARGRGEALVALWRQRYRAAAAATLTQGKRVLQEHFWCQPQLVDVLGDALYKTFSADWAVDMCREPAATGYVRRCQELVGFVRADGALDTHLRMGLVTTEGLLQRFLEAVPLPPAPAAPEPGPCPPSPPSSGELAAPVLSRKRPASRDRAGHGAASPAMPGHGQAPPLKRAAEPGDGGTANAPPGKSSATPHGGAVARDQCATPLRCAARAPPQAAGQAQQQARSGDLRDVLREIARILRVKETRPGWGRDVLRLPASLTQARAASESASAYRQTAKRIHPDIRERLSDADEANCHEALAKLQRARLDVNRVAKGAR